MNTVALPVTVAGFVVYDRYGKQLSLEEIAAALNSADQSVRPTEKQPASVRPTAMQLKLLNFIKRYIAETGTSPSFDEMRAGLELVSKSGIYRLLNGLQERGLIRRLPNRHRAIEVIDTGAAAS